MQNASWKCWCFYTPKCRVLLSATLAVPQPLWALFKPLKFRRSLCTELVRMDLGLLQGITWLEDSTESMVWKLVDIMIGCHSKYQKCLINLNNTLMMTYGGFVKTFTLSSPPGRIIRPCGLIIHFKYYNSLKTRRSWWQGVLLYNWGFPFWSNKESEVVLVYCLIGRWEQAATVMQLRGRWGIFTGSKKALILYKKSCKASLEILCIVLSCLFQKDGFKLGTCSAMAARMCAGMQNPSDKNCFKNIVFF